MKRLQETKKKIFAVSVLAICLAIIATGTLAFFTDDDRAHNVITSGGINITLVEEYDDSEFTGVMPGKTVRKQVHVENETDSADAWIRVKVDVSITAADGQTPLATNLGEKGSAVYCNVNYQDTKWRMQDGWYYYNAQVPTDGQTEILFDQVTFSPYLDNRYQGCTVHIDIQAQAVQTAHNPEPTENTTPSVLNAVGWPEND